MHSKTVGNFRKLVLIFLIRIQKIIYQMKKKKYLKIYNSQKRILKLFFFHKNKQI